MNFALIVAAGIGSRMKNSPLPKQFLKINEIPVLVYSLQAFSAHPKVDGILIVSHVDYIDYVLKIVEKYKISKVIGIVAGGSTRQESVLHGLEELKGLGAKNDDIVLIHDSARPLVNKDIISRNIEGCASFEAVTTAVNVVDTISVTDEDNGIVDVPNRERLYAIQTPQTFKFGLIYDAHQNLQTHPLEHITDDTSIIKHYGHDVKVVLGDKTNIKITTPEDIKIVQEFLNK